MANSSRLVIPINPNPNANEGQNLRNQITTLIGFLVDSISLKIKINTTIIPPKIKKKKYISN